MPVTDLNTAIEFLKGVGPARAELLRKELNIRSLGGLLNFFPNRYIDRTQFLKISQLQQNSSEVQLIGKITNIRTVSQNRGSRLVATFADESGIMELVWFRGVKWIKESLKLDTPYVAFGRVNWFNGSFNMAHPELELLTDYSKSLQTAMQPVYPSTENLTNKGVTNRVVIKMLQQLFLDIKSFEETLSEEVIKKHKLISKSEALFNIHFPKSQNLLTRAQQRLKFEELFFIQLQLIRRNLIHKAKIKGYIFKEVGNYFNTFYNDHLPFELTNAQKRVVKELRKDMVTGAQMNRLLQGDVGSGKTIVALLAMLLALDNGYQSAFMAPTEILAIQHFNAVSDLLGEMDVKVALLTGSTKTKDRNELHESLKDGSLHILIGTHALLEDKVQFQNLGLAIIDEQHRFGVAQRAKIWSKGGVQKLTTTKSNTSGEVGGAVIPPHILVMTATPIPRTLAMSVYGDLDISVIDEMPPGRKDIITAHRYDSNRLNVFRFMKDEIEKGRQVYVVYPLIEESQKLDLKDLMDGYESIVREFPQPQYQVSIVHGKMKTEDKDYEMNRFANGETNIMVATTVIEVGVNVPNASVMVVESAERFGLSQLHQLRGRVGRGADQSYCILMSSFKLSKEAKKRINTMVETNDGFKIAEVDLKLRGPGDLMGTQQSGVLTLRIADIVKDGPILKQARGTAIEVLNSDPNLSKPTNRFMAKAYNEITKNRAIWSNIS